VGELIVRSKPLRVVFVMAALVAAGCVAARAQQSSFFSKFSLNLLMGKSSARPVCNSVAGGGGEESSPETDGGFQERKWESLRCGIKAADARRFDEAAFIKSLRGEIERDIQAGGAHIDGGGDADAGGFHFEYSSGSRQGRIDVKGKKTGEGTYELKADLEEKSRK
jgi:hypothetical protein